MDVRIMRAIAEALKAHPDHDCSDPDKLVTISITLPHKVLHKCERKVDSFVDRSDPTPDP
jgi:hypothetical protein